MVLWPLAAACQELVPPAIVKTLADLVFAADIRHGVLAAEPFQDCQHLGLRINLTSFHAYPLRHYTRLTSCLSLKGSSILVFHIYHKVASDNNSP